MQVKNLVLVGTLEKMCVLGFYDSNPTWGVALRNSSRRAFLNSGASLPMGRFCRSLAGDNFDL
ncbi:hypothetical protein [Leptospira borgpetersenii]|uniref:hypothetical protein n=1 Tax=Leptospira borgpetersenii TaxID=174 RepID=UPI00187F18D9|nr:hypothetical protein [Leptospira borgpetersenii]MBE8368069.1 hypothetical protein [Leptospira borgpetersenii serovar Balcanica]MBF3351410.1 hypothetical protein [Leptospira borgpetersenii serovar Balcanica]